MRDWLRGPLGAIAAVTAALGVTAPAAAQSPPLSAGERAKEAKRTYDLPRGQENPLDVLPDPTERPVKLTPVDGRGRGKTIDEPSLRYFAPNRYRINTPRGSWATLRTFHQQFFIGTVADGWILNAQGSYSYSRWGFFSERDFCGWLLAENLDPITGSGQSPCPPDWNLPIGSASQVINCDRCDGGFGVTLTQNVTFRRNVYPWHTGPGVPPGAVSTDPSISRPAGYKVYWRYVSENGEWLAIADPDPTLAQAWFFIPRSAVGNICAAGAQPSPTWPGAMTCQT